VVEERLGVSFPDPYRWLEDNTEEVRAWQRAQAQLASGTVRNWTGYDRLRQEVERFYVGRTVAPRHAAGRWFVAERVEGASQVRAIVTERLGEPGRVLFDPADEDPRSPPFLSWISPSPDGRVLALGVCRDGSERNTIRLIEVASGRLLAGAPTQTLMDSWLGGAQWLADSSGFFFTALAGDPRKFSKRIYFHRLQGPTQVEPVPLLTGGKDYVGVLVSRCGRWAIAMERMLTPVPVAIRDLARPDARWGPFVTRVEGLLAGHVVGDRYLALTNVGASRGRIVAVDLDAPDPNDPAGWTEIVAESEAVLRSIQPVGERLYVHALVDTYSVVRIFDGEGRDQGEAPLPAKGAIAEPPFPMMSVFSSQPADAYVFGFSAFTQSGGLYLHRPGEDRAETLVRPKLRIEGVVVEDRWAEAADGVRVPYHAVRLASLDMVRSQPTLIYAYGSAGIPTLPQFPGAIAAFIESGGVYVLGHPRGGGELGMDWWHGGVLQNRQNSYDDLFAIAEDLIARGVTTPELLGVTGGSAGGLMSGVAVTQRPELWRVAVPRVPVLDLIGGLRDPYIDYVARLEYGDPDDPRSIPHIASFSPYQLVADGVDYPAVYIDAGDADPRCAPWHARKFAARLQHAQAGESPILLHVWDNAGHGWATTKDVQVDEDSEWLSFIMRELGLTPRAE
jgi:prolyl oligopeptidase